ncbi:MAG: ATP-binding protein [Myxococcales bacterium]|nr:ATP-binding protein [Myxococcales bacterium]
MEESLQALRARIVELTTENEKLRAVQEAVATANAHAAELMVALEEAKDEVAERNHQLQSLLDNVQCGFLVVDRDLVISPVVTRSCQGLFDCQEVAGRSLPEVLGLDAGDTDVLSLGVDEVFFDVLPEEVTLEQLPRRFVVGRRVLEFGGTVIRDEDSDVQGLLFSIFDVTLLEKESRDRALSHALISILRQRDAFRAFVGEARHLLDAGRKALSGGDETTARRVLHTLKGMFGCYALSELSALVHDLESEPKLADSAIGKVEASFQDFLATHDEVLQLELDARDGDCRYTVTETELAALKDAAGDAQRVFAWIDGARGVPVHKLIGPLSTLVAQLARRLGKQAKLELEGGDVRVDEQRVLPVLRELPHLLRNAVAHGIEAASERGNKPPMGRVRLAFVEVDKVLSITVSDDGAGIDEGRLRRAAGQRAEGVGDLLDLLSLDGVSTATVADIAGRGVGVASVRHSVEAVGGWLTVVTEAGGGATFTLNVPKAARPSDRPLGLVSSG